MKPTQDEHVGEWIAAYFDGELRGERLRQVETHLAVCAECRTELEDLGRLSDLLQDVPPQTPRVSRGRFAAQVALRLPRGPEEHAGKRAARKFWLAVPVGVFSGWAFLQAIMLALPLGALLLNSFPLGNALMSAGAANNALSDSLGGLFSSPAAAGGWVNLAGFSVEMLLIDLALTILLAGLGCSWLASWWVVNKH